MRPWCRTNIRPMPSSRADHAVGSQAGAAQSVRLLARSVNGKVLGNRREDAISSGRGNQGLSFCRVAPRRHHQADARGDRRARRRSAPAMYLTKASSPAWWRRFPLPLESLTWMRDQLVELGQIPRIDVAKMIGSRPPDTGARADR